MITNALYLPGAAKPRKTLSLPAPKPEPLPKQRDFKRELGFGFNSATCAR